jgi:hypothetical protein
MTTSTTGNTPTSEAITNRAIARTDALGDEVLTKV